MGIASVVMEVEWQGTRVWSRGRFGVCRVAHALVRSGYQVSALLRPASNRKNLDGLDLEIAATTAILWPSRGPWQACVFCSMSPPTTAFGRANRKKFCTTTRRGTRVLMQTALAQGVERIVYTSSVATICMFGRRTAR